MQGLSATMTAPSFANLTTVLTGWVFAGRRTVTRMILAAGDAAEKHFSSYHRLFSAARWSLDALGLAVLDLMQRFLGDVIVLGLDDTLARKRGLKMFGTGMHHDPLLSSRGKVITNWGHSWVVLGVIVELPFRRGHYYCLPILFRLYLNKKSAEKHRRAYCSRPELAVEMLVVLCHHRENQRFHVVGDSAYGGQSVLCHLPTNCDLTSRLVKDARLYGPPPQREAGTNGRPRMRGQRLPTPQAMLAGRCRHVTLDIYGRTEEARLAEQVAHAHAAPQRPLRVVAVEALKGGRGQEAFYSTCWQATALQVILWYAMRWSIEVMNRDSKQHLGFQEPQGWTRRSVQRTAPLAMLLYSLIVLWFTREGHRSWRPMIGPWYISKTAPSFADMLGTLRRLSIRQQVLTLALGGPGSRKIKQLLENVATLAV
jgi:DDE superfamily endonuclease